MLPARLATCLDRALHRRAALLADADTDVGRLFNGAADGIPGLVLERYGPGLGAQTAEGHLQLAEVDARALAIACATRVGAPAVYHKVFPKDRSAARSRLDALHTNATPWWGTPLPPEFSVREQGRRYLVRLYDGYATGLFLDHRANRALLTPYLAGRRLLNLFAYTCAYAVVAARAGAAATANVDVARKALEWGKRNLTLNDCPLDTHRFYRSDVLAFLRRATRQGLMFDVAVVDPPTFGRDPQSGARFALTSDLPDLLDAVIARLTTDGLLLLSVNHRATTVAALVHAVTLACQAQGRRAEELARPELPADFRGDPEHAKSILMAIR